MSLQAALEAYKRQDLATARQLLAPILAQQPNNERAWTLQMYVAETTEEKRQAIQNVLNLNPSNEYALQMQQQLGVMEEPPAAPPAAPPPPATPHTPEAPEPPPSPVPTETEDDGDVYEMMWDCQYCNTPKLLGLTHRYCPNCGAAQDAEARYFPSDDEKVAVKDHEYVGVDKTCEACDTPNAGNAEFCINCGSPLSEEARAKKLASELRAEGERFDQSSLKDQQRREQEREDEEAEAEGKSNNTRNIIIGVVVVILVLAGVFIFWTKEVSVIATGHAWERSIKIEDYAARSKSAWCDSMPRDAYSVSRTKKVRSHKQVPDGQECSTRRIDQGDGTYREQQECRTKYREEPVYDMYCNYRVDRWEYHRSVTDQGTNKQARWPQYRLSCTGQRKGCERESGRSSDYILLLENSKSHEQYKCSVDEKLWQQSQINSRWKLDVSAITGGARCSSLAPL